MEEGARKDIAYAEYYYFRGNPQMAAQMAKQYLTCSNTELRLSACLIYAFSNLSIGQIEQAKQVLEKIKSTLTEDKERAQQIRVIDAFIAMAAAVLLHLPLPEDIPSMQEFIPILPFGLRSFALYVEAHYLYLQKNYEKSIDR